MDLPPKGGPTSVRLRSLPCPRLRAPPGSLLGLLPALGGEPAGRSRGALRDVQREAASVPQDCRAVRRLAADVLQLSRRDRLARSDAGDDSAAPRRRVARAPQARPPLGQARRTRVRLRAPGR